MKEHEKKKPVISVTEDNRKGDSDSLLDNSSGNKERLKKALIFGLMAIVFLGCLYLIFAPSDRSQPESIGLSDIVPQASDAGLQADKQKAYEQELFEQKQQEKRAALMDLSDYWSTDSSETEYSDMEEYEEEAETASYGYGRTQSRTNPALNSYRNIQSSLGTFYEENNEAEALRRELEELKGNLEQKESNGNPMENQLALMEKSYEMAAKYFPQNNSEEETTDEEPSAFGKNFQKEILEPLSPAKKQPVSILYRKQTDAEFLAEWSTERNWGFHTAGSDPESIFLKNSIRACVHNTQTVTVGNSSIRLRLLEPARVGKRIIPVRALLTASVKIQNGRLLLHITSMEIEGAIIPMDVFGYDLDGQLGLNIPHSQEMSALTSIASNMGNTAGTNIMLTSSAGQQAAADLSRGVIQGTSGYFSKKMNTPKVTLKAGHQLFLVSKK